MLPLHLRLDSLHEHHVLLLLLEMLLLLKLLLLEIVVSCRNLVHLLEVRGFVDGFVR